MSDTPPANPPDDPAQLRKKLDDALKANRERDEKIRRLEATNMIHDAGLSHLNEHQRSALMSIVPQDAEMNVEVLKGAATNLGFPSTPAPATPPATPPEGGQPPPATGDQNQPDGGQGTIPPTYDPGTSYLTPAVNSVHPDPRVQASITGLTAMEEAHIMALRGGASMDGGFEEKLKGAKTKAEALAIIRQQGPKQGIVLSSELD